MTILLTRALKRAQRDYRKSLKVLEETQNRFTIRLFQAGLVRDTPLTPDVVIIRARIADETEYSAALHDCLSAEQVLLETARTFCESKGFERICEAGGGLCPQRIALIFEQGPKTTRVRRELVRICLAI